MTPDLLAYLTPEERQAWERCEAEASEDSDFAAFAHLTLPTVLLALAKARRDLRTYGRHLDGCGCHATCGGQQEHGCTCGLEDALHAR